MPFLTIKSIFGLQFCLKGNFFTPQVFSRSGTKMSNILIWCIRVSQYFLRFDCRFKFLSWPFLFVCPDPLTLATFCVSFFLTAVKSQLVLGQSLQMGLINCRYKGAFYHHFSSKMIKLFSNLLRQNALYIKKNDCCADRLDCEQSLFSSKIRGKERKTSKRASVTVSVT